MFCLELPCDPNSRTIIDLDAEARTGKLGDSIGSLHNMRHVLMSRSPHAFSPAAEGMSVHTRSMADSLNIV